MMQTQTRLIAAMGERLPSLGLGSKWPGLCGLTEHPMQILVRAVRSDLVGFTHIGCRVLESPG